MTMCVNSINPFLTGTRTTLAENVITLFHRRCNVGCCYEGGRGPWLVTEAAVCLSPHFHQQLWYACNVRGGLWKRHLCPFSLSVFEAEREPIANDSVMRNVAGTMCCSFFGLNWLARWTESKYKIKHQHPWVTKWSMSQNAKWLPAAKGCRCLQPSYGYIFSWKGKKKKKKKKGWTGTMTNLWNKWITLV